MVADVFALCRDSERMAGEQQSVGLSLGILGVTLCFLYVLFFGVRGEHIRRELAYLQTLEARGAASLTAQTASVGTSAILQDTTSTTGAAIEETSPTIAQPPRVIVTAPDSVAGRRFFSTQELFRPEEETEVIVKQGKILLADTREREGTLKSLEAVGLQGYQEYILKNIENTHFIRFVDNPATREHLRQTVAAAGGNIVEITDKNTINQFQLFGDEVWIINMPGFEKIKVLLLVFFKDEGDVRYLQVDKEIYPARKQALGAIFAPRYDR